MRLLLPILLLCAVPLRAQQKLYAITRSGGTLNGGALISFNDDGSDPKAEINFGKRQTYPKPVIIQGPDGYLYGVTAGGGNRNDVGGIFKIRPDGTDYIQVHDFSNTDSSEDGISDGGLTIGPDGKTLYGTTRLGGINNAGVLYKISTDGTGYKKLFEFTGPTAHPASQATLIFGSDGKLYGTNYSNLTSSPFGTLYKINTDGSGYAKILDFGTSANFPPVDIIMGNDGKIYGCTGRTLFSVATNGAGFVTLYSFPQTGSFGVTPNSGLIQLPDGKLYGTTQGGGQYDGGMIFKIDTDGAGFTNLFDFGALNGRNLASGLLVGADGKFYGSTDQGGIHDGGVVFRINTNGTSYTVLKDLITTQPGGRSRLIQDTNGDLTGFNTYDGSYQKGFVFQMHNDGSGFFQPFSFGAPDTRNYYTNEGLTQGLADHLYAMVSHPGAGMRISFLRYDKTEPDNSSFFDFNEIVPGPLTTSLIQDKDGYWYGAARFGGSFGAGVLFKAKSDGSSYLKLHDFVNGTGDAPEGNLLLAFDGLLYGTCSYGGTSNAGVVYRLKRDGTGYEVIHHFTAVDGTSPIAGLVQGKDGRLYGTTVNGGIIFKLNTDGTGFTKLHNFTPGEQCHANLVSINNALYGTATVGGVNNKGFIFRINHDGSGYLKLHDFDGTDGSRTYSALTPYKGVLYGATYAGGANDMGTIFKINYDGTGFTKLIDLDHSTGGSMAGDLLAICEPEPMPEITASFADVLFSSSTVGNQWFKDGVIMPGETNQTLNVSSTGTYTVQVSIDNCVSEMSLGKTVNITGISVMPFESNSMFVYPNPAGNTVHVTFSGQVMEDFSVEIMDMVGQSVYHQRVGEQKELDIDLSSLRNGTYIMKISTRKTIYFSKVVKQ
ncbi:MAG TPA: choice-of-anchor tandem repeat GloVer-containing protein [Chryseolinea sp.]|nr:choice-of-anchor tandem repeat GloVer-containing protein [Chryseolinea sp.]